MDSSAAGSLMGIVMSPIMLFLLYITIKSAATGPIDRNGLVGIRIQATQRSDAAWRAGHIAALPVARTAFGCVLLFDVVALSLLFAGPNWLKPWIGILPGAAMVLSMVPIVTVATRAANAAGDDPTPQSASTH